VVGDHYTYAWAQFGFVLGRAVGFEVVLGRLASGASPNSVGNGFTGRPNGSVNDIQLTFALADLQIFEPDVEWMRFLIALLPFEANMHFELLFSLL